MIIVISILFAVSLLVAVWSLDDLDGEKGVNEIQKARRKDAVKGTIIFLKDKKDTHYSSYSV